jgi:hypothetical protein
MEARHLKVAGIVLTSVGLALEVATIGIWSSFQWVPGVFHDEFHYSDAEAARGDLFTIGGISTAVSAAVMMGIGIPLWSVGANRDKVSRGLVFTPSGLVGTF